MPCLSSLTLCGWMSKPSVPVNLLATVTATDKPAYPNPTTAIRSSLSIARPHLYENGSPADPCTTRSSRRQASRAAARLMSGTQPCFRASPHVLIEGNASLLQNLLTIFLGFLNVTRRHTYHTHRIA